MGMINKRCPRCSKKRPHRHDGTWRRIHAERDEFLPEEWPCSTPYRLVCMFCVHSILRATLPPEEFAAIEAATRPNSSPRVKPVRTPASFYKRLVYAVTSVSDRLNVKIADIGGGISHQCGSWCDFYVPLPSNPNKVASLLSARGLDAVKEDANTVRVFERRGTENSATAAPR